MNNPIDLRQHLSEFVENSDWDDEVHVDELDGVEHNESDPQSYYVLETNGQRKKLAYDSHNALTQFIHDPDDAWYRLVQRVGPVISDVLDSTKYTVDDFRELWYDGQIVDERHLITEKRGASIFSEVLTRLDTRQIQSTVPRYYIALHQVTVWKNKSVFPIESLKVGGTRKYYTTNGPVKLLPPKEKEPEASKVELASDDKDNPFDS